MTKGAERPDAPMMSSSEETSFKNCRLAHHFAYDLGYAPIVTNRKLAVGIGAHEGIEVYYRGGGPADIEKAIDKWAKEREAELTRGQADLIDRAAFAGDLKMVKHLVEGYIEWVVEEKYDEGYDIVEIEEAHYIQVPGAPTLLPVKLDLLQRDKATGKLRIVDFKTRAQFYTDTTAYQLSEQNGNYSIAVFALYGEVPEMLAYRELRKVNRDNANSKPPFFRQIPVRLTREEMAARAREYVEVATERMDPDRALYANPGSCCGSWKNDWRSPCLLVHQGYSPEEALEMSSKFAPKDNYARYEEGEEDEN